MIKLTNNFSFLDINECEIDPGVCGSSAGKCVNLVNHGFNCSCASGFQLTQNWISKTVHCEDINECLEGAHDCDNTTDEYCSNYAGSYQCG